ncbi:hypothetical protein K491DRAFT_631528 [Lophiostoma macrostomum CBS 122681]|uniref:Uncharacterized protein n=1 Tax=Lophiostoma macrostomum CBS 122681 TaxID=1314788 RepID=A0A6A6T5X2_9PLEO|nr:hypothetical protein K491DRAFT_631528 [Lophiostoma macrostomum CBS 122681]
MSLTGTYHVYLGFWTNWSFGKVGGATLTLTQRDGGLLIAFIAIFVGGAGKSFWRIACFILHRMLSSPRPEDGIYHQTQAILRNSDTAQDAAWSLGQVIWAWRVPARFRKPFPRLFAIITLALVISVSFGVAGVFSSHITTDTANEVLLTGANCGPLKGDDPAVSQEAYLTLFEPLQSKRVNLYSDYALRCYSGDLSQDDEDCNPYIQAKLKTTVDANASCPFSSNICKLQTGNLIVDTGLLDSHTDLGINAPKENRFQMRFVHQCAPIVTEGFSAPFKANDTDEETMRYYYGDLLLDDGGVNYTQEMPMLDSTFDIYNESTYRPVRSRPRADYGINVLKAYSGSPDFAETFSMFTPIQELHRDDADVMLFFLSAPDISFLNVTDDPWFSAHREGRPIASDYHDGTQRTYLTDEPAAVLGCTMQLQFCNANLPEGSRCSTLTGGFDDRVDITEIYQTPSQKTMFRWAADVFQLGFFSISGIVDNMGVAALTARQGLNTNRQGPLPSNQWQLEVEQWVGASLASIQGTFVEMGNGPTPTYQQFRKAPNETEQETICKSIKIVTTKYSSFSVLGISLILIIGGLIMILDFSLEALVDSVQACLNRRAQKKNKSTSFGTYKRLEWEANATLQLQRLAHEHIRVGTWKNAAWSHPVTERGEKLAVIDARDGERPIYIPPHDWQGMHSSDSTATDSKDGTSWGAEKDSVRQAFEEGLRKGEELVRELEQQELRRSATFDSMDEIVKKGVKRTDTSATLVGEITNDKQESEKVPDVPAIPGGDWDVQTPTSETMRVGDDVDKKAT